jgi:DNA-directed RNA polymerase specialized sigma24 family protein
MRGSPHFSTVANATDEELVAASGRHLHAATRELVARHSPMVYALCFRWLGDEELASGVCVDAFSQVFAEKHTTEIFQIRLYRFISLYLEGIHTPAFVVRSAPKQRSLGNLLTRCMAALEPEHRLILLLRDLCGLTTETIASVLEIPNPTAYSRLSRSRTELAREIARHATPADVL